MNDKSRDGCFPCRPVRCPKAIAEREGNALLGKFCDKY